jgi:hypothetical protein
MPFKNYAKILLALVGVFLVYAALAASSKQTFRPTDKAFYLDNEPPASFAPDS